ncbi:efflux RND transporter periplasmic adaptor subunit, partial [bacterium]|nr:efflux RND transporter periplasmic adaptor subunit [bacterium]
MCTQPSTAATPALLICAALAVAITPALPARAEEHARPAAAASEETVWTCSMHPQIRQPRQGRCPICGMDLIPVAPVGAGTGPREIELSSNAMLLAAVRTAPVERTLVSHELRLSGKITYDETRLAYCTTRIAGRLEKLYVDYTGVRVNVGDHLVSLYSPDLYVMQAQYLIALRNGTAPAAAGRNGLILAGLTTQQVDRIEKTGEPELYIDFYSPLNGTVVRKEGVEGMYVEEGTRIYTIADLEYLW